MNVPIGELHEERGMKRTQLQPQGYAISAKQALKVLIGKIRYLVAKTLYFYHTRIYYCIKVDVAYRWPKLL